MNFIIRRSFEKDTLKLPLQVQKNIGEMIIIIQKVKTLSEIPNCKKLTGYKNAYRIRIGMYRIGFFFEKNTIELTRVLARKDMYRFFP
jgi:mRNA interferase RelE/StbE